VIILNVILSGINTLIGFIGVLVLECVVVCVQF